MPITLEDIQAFIYRGEVANYSALPSAASVPNAFYWVQNSQGTKYIGVLWGGSYYPSGTYHSNGVSWEYMDTPSQATLAEVDTGTVTDKWVSPSTLANSIWAFTVSKVLATTLTGLNVALTGTITSSDSILTAFGRMQNQVTEILTELSNYATLTGTETLTNKTIKKRILVVTQSATPSTNIDNGDIIQITGLAQAITSMTTNLTGTPYDGQMIMWQVTDNGTARALTLGSAFAASTNVALPTTTVAGVMLTWITMYKSGIAKHEVQYVN